MDQASGQDVLALDPFTVEQDAVLWPAAGLVAPEIGFSNPIEGCHAATGIEPGAQA
jgi:hypothetical protein